MHAGDRSESGSASGARAGTDGHRSYRRRAVLAAVGAGAAALAGCAGNGGSESGSGGGTTEHSLLLNWQPSGLHVPYYAAAAEGFYAEEGIDLTEIESGQGSDFSATQAGLGNADFAITSSDQVLNINADEDLAVRSVGVVMQRGPTQVFTARENFGEELTDPEQLASATIGSGPGMVRRMVEAYLEQEGLLDSVEYVDSGFDTVQQLLSGEIDAAGGVFSDVVDARNQGSRIDALSVNETVPAYGHLIATAESFAEANPDVVRSFLRATARGAVWANRNPEEATDQLVEAVPELEGTRESQLDKWGALRSGFMLSEAVEEHGWGYNDAAVWESVAATLSDGDFPGGEADPDAAWTNEYLDTDDGYVGGYADRVEGTF